MVAPFIRSWVIGVFPSKMVNSGAFKCISRVKTKQGTKLRFVSSPKYNSYWRSWIHTIGRTFLPKDLRVRSEHFEDHCLHRSYLMRVRIALLTGEWLDTHLITRLEVNFKYPISCVWYIYNLFKNIYSGVTVVRRSWRLVTLMDHRVKEICHRTKMIPLKLINISFSRNQYFRRKRYIVIVSRSLLGPTTI